MTMHIASDGWYRRRVAVRFRDLDPLGHAHHTLPLVYLEEARAAFWRELTGSATLDSIDYVMAEITVRFHARIHYPADVEVALAVDHVGSKSFSTRFELRTVPTTPEGSCVLLASGCAVQVAYDYGHATAKPIEERIRATLLAWHEALPQNSSAMEAETTPMNPPSQ
jgi:acyl-CoA thioester hydrolase